MRKFKHIKLGITEEWSIKNEMYETWISTNEKHYIDRVLVENSNDWEEIKEEPNYLITAFRLISDGEIVKIGSDGKYGYWFTLKDMLSSPPCVESGDFEIYSVKNKYGIEYTLGDTVNYNVNNVQGKPFKIHNFFINRDNILLVRSSSESSAACEDINTIYKFKAPIYTTTDNSAIFEGDRLRDLDS